MAQTGKMTSKYDVNLEDTGFNTSYFLILFRRKGANKKRIRRTRPARKFVEHVIMLKGG